MSTSKSSSATSTSQRDGRVAADNGAIGISSEGDVSVNMVADEAFDLGADAIAGMVRGVSELLDASGDQADTMADTIQFALNKNGEFATRALDELSDGLGRAQRDTADFGKVALDELSDGMGRAQRDSSEFALAALDIIADTSRDTNEAMAGALYATQDTAKSEAGQIGEQLIKMAIPAAAIAFVAAKILN